MSTRATKVTLRLIADDDLPALFEFGRDPIAVQMAAFTSRNPDDHGAFLQFWAKLRANRNNIVLIVLADGEIAGSVGSYPSEGKQEVTHWIGRPSRAVLRHGRGREPLGSEAPRAAGRTAEAIRELTAFAVEQRRAQTELGQYRGLTGETPPNERARPLT